MLFVMLAVASACVSLVWGCVRASFSDLDAKNRAREFERWNRMRRSASGEIRIDDSGTRFPKPGATFRGEIRRSW